MKSANFEFLRGRWKELAGLGGFAEHYVHPDPPSAAVKLRSYAEQIVELIWETARLPKLFQANLNDKLNNDTFREVVPRVVVSKLHALRIHGNKAAHGEKVTASTAQWLLREAFELGRWLLVASGAGSKDDCPDFIEPSPPSAKPSADQLKQEKRAVLEKLAAQEAEMLKLLAELEAAREAAQTAEASADELRSTLEAGTQAANVLDFTEEQTRHALIDSMLISAGWDVGRNRQSNSEVGQEIEVEHQPTDSGIGYADYVLYDEDEVTPLAVIEAKKTSKDAEAGRTQAKCYADGLEQMSGTRPVIFYTNGFDIWIWNDAEHEPPRKIFGFYSKDSLQYKHFQRQYPMAPSVVKPDAQIAGRLYQMEAINRVVERYAAKHSRALLVQATGTGKTRVAVSLCAALINAKRVRRVLFLCDRRELRKQAHNVFKRFLPGEPRVYVSATTAQDRDKRIYLATYPAMMKCFESFDVGFFDLIIADESHRSIYNRYRDLVRYFDGLCLGLTATPRSDLVSHNTYQLFGCDDGVPTAYFSYEDAINANPPYLSRFEVEKVTTPFLRKGIKYTEMTAKQREQLEEDEVMPEAIEFEQREVDKHIFNKDTNRKILRNLMEHGIRDASGTRVGKTIIFARNHNHAVLLQNLFDEMYPQYGGNFCRVIDNYDPRAEELIDDFKGEGKNPDLTIAISVDMLDTGIDVPEIVNLVFAKPVYSYIKFWQMIGRGTRLCEDLFGRGQNKSKFLIFDHWGNFEYFEEQYKAAEVSLPKSLPQRLFEARIRLAEAALQQQDTEAFDLTISLIRQDIADLPDKTIAVREHWKQIKIVEREELLRQFDAATKGVLFQEIAPLMQWRNVAGHEAAYKFDLNMCMAQKARLDNASRYGDLRDDLRNQIEQLQMNLSQVRARASAINEARSAAFWDNATVSDLERIRSELRGIMKYRQPSTTTAYQPKVIDVVEDDALIERKPHKVKLEGLDLAAYRARVEQVLKELFDENPTLQRIQRGEPVTDDDLRALNSLVLTQDPELDLSELTEYYPETAGHLDLAIRNIIGLDGAAVRRRFETFVQTHASLNSQQIRFLDMLQNHIASYGSITVDRLYEDPFTSLHSDGIDGVFTDEATIQELIDIIGAFNPAAQGGESE
ncbi:MAG: DEAD/DEAH box helicase family protein [Phycisphaerae bacterium]|nr:DEAD/DEAH box helicase family protein [Phycisphaerae bacterium]